VQYEAHRLPNPDRIYFDLHETTLAPELENKVIEIGDPLLTRVRVAQPSSGLTRVVPPPHPRTPSPPRAAALCRVPERLHHDREGICTAIRTNAFAIMKSAAQEGVSP